MAERGFTLLEVVVALIVFALTFGALAGIFSTGFRQSRSAERTIEATLTARSLLERIGNETRLEPGRFGDDIDNGLRFEASIRPIGEPDPDFGFVLYEVDLVVAEADAAPDQGLRLTTLRLGTADVEP
ncbi:MAG: prepilin-type N-terminal cleavage/methylation domain-containing protein [Geminicoccaceae bacterium]|nr:prepilin-type N-terminal cleavage/methylation domain-containing protein [Geminicoccaceae bacterium]